MSAITYQGRIPQIKGVHLKSPKVPKRLKGIRKRMYRLCLNKKTRWDHRVINSAYRAANTRANRRRITIVMRNAGYPAAEITKKLQQATKVINGHTWLLGMRQIINGKVTPYNHLWYR